MEVQARSTILNAGLERQADKTSSDAQLRQACKDMESVFMSYLLKSMRSTVKSSDLFGSEKEESMFRDMLDDEVARAASEQKGIGIADMLYRQLSRMDNPSPDANKALKVDGSVVEK